MMQTDEEMVTREAGKYWWVFLLGGIAWIFLAWLVLRMNITSLATVGVLLGVMFLLAGIHEVMVAGMSSTGWKVFRWIMAVLFFLGALWGFIRPVNTFFALVSVLGLILILYGTMEIVVSISTRDVNRYWWIGLIAGILLVLLAFWASGSGRVYQLTARTYLILFWVGFFALIRGITHIVLAFSIHHAAKRAGPATAVPATPAV